MLPNHLLSTHRHTLFFSEKETSDGNVVRNSFTHTNCLYIKFSESLHFTQLSIYSLTASTVRAEFVVLCFDHKHHLNEAYAFFFSSLLFMQTCRLCSKTGHYKPNWYYANTDKKMSSRDESCTIGMVQGCQQYELIVSWHVGPEEARAGGGFYPSWCGLELCWSFRSGD